MYATPEAAVRLRRPTAAAVLTGMIALLAGCVAETRRSDAVYSTAVGAGDATGLFLSRGYQAEARQVSLARRKQLDERWNGVGDEVLANVPPPIEPK